MDYRLTAVLVVSCALAIAGAPVFAEERGRLDLRLDPRAVEAWDAQPPPHDLALPPSADLSAQVGPPPGAGWSLRPRLDLDLVEGEGGIEAGSGNRSVELGDVDIELKSLGVRLQRRW